MPRIQVAVGSLGQQIGGQRSVMTEPSRVERRSEQRVFTVGEEFAWAFKIGGEQLRPAAEVLDYTAVACSRV